VERLLTEAQQTDQEEDQRWGKGQPADPLPADLAHAQSRLARLRQAMNELKQEAQQQLEAVKENFTPRKRGRPRKQDAAAQQPEDPVERKKMRNQAQRAESNAAQPSRQYNFVDPDSRVMLDNARKCFTQAYNAQIATDSHAQVIVAAELTQQTTDRQQLLPMVQAVREATGSVPKAITADAGYWDTTSLRDSSLEGIQVLVSPDSKTPPPGAPLPPRVPRNTDALRMREQLASETGKALYATRKSVVEPVFGQIKEVRNIRRFRLRGLKQAACEWKLICATHNLLKLFRHRMAHTPGWATPAAA
jgi:hypothetical protein